MAPFDSLGLDLPPARKRPTDPGLRPEEKIVVGFAGGGGSCEGIYMATGRHPDAAMNHDPEAVAMHRRNHPNTVHYCQNIWQVDPYEVFPGCPIGLAWFSPDCKHFSKARGDTPKDKSIRDLAWVVVSWAKARKPRVIWVENVEEFQTWCPLLPDGTADMSRKGETFNAWVAALRREGYKVEYREIRACDYGTPTIRKRLYLCARRDGFPIVWPKPTHGKAGSGLLPYVWVADCIDWSLPMPSIFDRKKPLVDATLRRVARGVMRYVVNAEKPFLVQTGYGERQGQSPRVMDVEAPLGTIVAGGIKHGVCQATVAPHISTIDHQGNTGGGHAPANAPLGTATSKARHTLVGATMAAWMAQHNTGVVGHSVQEPASTFTSAGCQQQPVGAFLAPFYSSASGRSVAQPGPTTTAGGEHHALVTVPMEEADWQGANRVAAFIAKYYGTAVGQALDEGLHAITSKGRFALVTVAGRPITNIGMRMLIPRELFTAQGFRRDYVIDHGHDEQGRVVVLTKTAQIRMVGNSVCPPMAEALVRASFGLAPAVARIEERMAA